MSLRIAVLADDLTGAGDTAVQFVRAGWTAELQLEPAQTAAEVLAVTTDSRACGTGEAARRVREATAELRAAGARHVFKKIDSTLRGPVAAEIRGMLSALPPGVVAVVCPAYPAVGRTVRDGTLLVDGVPVSQTAVASDPVTPVTTSSIPALLDAPLVALDPQGSPADWAGTLLSAGPVVVVDAEDDADLRRVAAAVVELGERAVAVGSAGLAEPLAELWRGEAPTPTVLVVVTSLHDAARGQARALADAGAPCHEPTAEQLLDGAAWEQFVDAVLASADEQPEVLLLRAPGRGGAAVTPVLVVDRLARAATAVVRRRTVAGLVVTGGDGARAVLAGLQATGVRLHSQIAPGVPLGRLVGGWAAGLAVATKAGGFGDADVLIRAAQGVRRDRSLT